MPHVVPVSGMLASRDEQAEAEAESYRLFQLYLRHLCYYSERIPDLTPIEGAPAWQGRCPLCGGPCDINALSGWWSCSGCGRQGEAYTLEYLLHGEYTPAECRRRVEALIADSPLYL